MISKIQKSADNMRKNIIELAYRAGSNGAHLGSALSIVEIVATLYVGVMKFSPWADRDRFLPSKGHGGLAYYTALHEAGLIDKETLYTYEQNGGDLPGQPCMNEKFGIEISSGSLGVGLGVGAGCALAAKMQKSNRNIYVLMGDGECNEGSIYEAAQFAASNELYNLIAILDANGLQSDGEVDSVLKVNYKEMWKGFGWEVKEVDGHNIDDLYQCFVGGFFSNKPVMVIAKTIKGKGISFMENNNEWHHNVLIKDKYEAAMKELNA